MNKTRPNSIVKFDKELEIILIMSEIECVERIINLLKSKKVPSEVLWLKDANQAMDFLESRNAYEGKQKSNAEKLFVVDPRCTVDTCIELHNSFQAINFTSSSHFFVLSKYLTQDESEFLDNIGIQMMDETFQIQIGRSRFSGQGELFTC